MGGKPGSNRSWLSLDSMILDVLMVPSAPVFWGRFCFWSVASLCRRRKILAIVIPKGRVCPRNLLFLCCDHCGKAVETLYTSRPRQPEPGLARAVVCRPPRVARRDFLVQLARPD